MSEVKEPHNQSTWVHLLPDGISQFLLGVYFILSQWSPSDSVSVATGDSLYLILLGIILGLFTALDRILTKQEHRVSLNWKLLVTGFFIWLMFATLQTAGKGDFRIASLGFWQSVSMLGVVSCFYSQAMKPRRLESVLRWILGTVAGTVLLALYQYLISFPRMREAFQADPASFLSEKGIAVGSAEAMQWENRLMSTEPLGPFALTNSLAGFVGPWFIIIIALLAWVLIPSTSQETKTAMNSREWIRRFPSFFLTLWVFAIGAGTVLMLTKSRTAWLAFVVTSIVLFLGRDSLGSRSWSHLHRYRNALAPVLLLMGIVGGIFLWRDPDIVREAGKSFAYRVQYWRGASDIVESSPLFGVGPLNFQSAYPAYKEITASETPADPHNMWVEIATWGGLPLLVLGLIAAGGVIQLFGVNLATEASKVLKEPEEASPPKTSLHAIDFGAAFGLVCVVAFSFLAPDVDSMLSALIFAGGAFYVALTLSASAWIAFVRENRAKIGLVLCTFMAIHLFFSGGWMQPGCMNTLLVGAALAFVSTHRRPAKTDDLHEWSPWIPTILWTGLLVSFLFSTYVPESRLAAWQLNHQFGLHQNTDASQLREMLDVNKQSTELANAISSHAKEKVLQNNLGETARQEWIGVFYDATNALTKRSPRNWGSWYSSGADAMILADNLPTSHQEKSKLNDLARVSFEQARLLNPNSIMTQLQAAVIETELNLLDEASQRLEQVELIESTTPHQDRKLAVALVYVPQDMLQAITNFLHLQPATGVASGPETSANGAAANQLQDWVLDARSGLVRAEPVFRYLRNRAQIPRSNSIRSAPNNSTPPGSR